VTLTKLIKIVIHELGKIIEQLISFDYSEIPYSSLLIVYDCDYFLNCESELVKNNFTNPADEQIRFNLDTGPNSDDLKHEHKKFLNEFPDKINSFVSNDIDGYLKEKLNIKIIDFAYFRDQHLKTSIDDEHLTSEKNITNAILNLIQFLKNDN
jgi:hypothetical protein